MALHRSVQGRNLRVHELEFAVDEWIHISRGKWGRWIDLTNESKYPYQRA